MHVLKTLAVAFVLAAAVLSQAQSASAQTTTPSSQTIHTTAKDIDGKIGGIVGCGLLGTDIGLLMPPMFGLHDQKWAWGVFPVVMAGAGVGVGFAVADPIGNAGDVALLVSGMGLFVPALIGTLAWKSNKEDRDLLQSRPPPAVLSMGRINLQAPSISTAPVYSAQERSRYNVAQRNSVRVTLLSGTF